ncbi:putative signal peptide and transmembrane protein [Rhodopirellula islandica]|uniref:Signal peptide and transmembrane protein n=1 Tax=Rhodopirellula islandica TaxID=595434 RepID=A0A0J1BI28_RHOIS|nr:family 16 glycoside hydrolase [Rhodopirellula islandica]KLU06206.1 putative signal peptide and transmembrane protein [Rhodopirellula islandica]
MAAKSDAETKNTAKSQFKWRPLAGKWDEAHFGGDGGITRENWKKTAQDDSAKLPATGELFRLGMGDPLTGIRWTGDFPLENYELRLQARRTDGFDFFAAVTFPVGKEHCSFVLGGWGGGVVGISSIDGNDASSNETTGYKDFENKHWYNIRIRVDKETVTTWIDDSEWSNVNRSEHTFDIRIEMDPCLPLGIANFQCESEIRGLEIRRLDDQSPAEKPESPSEEASAITPAGNP